MMHEDEKPPRTEPYEEPRVAPDDAVFPELLSDEQESPHLSRAFLARRGSIQVGPGHVGDDIRRARRQRGRERW